jgi:hypothetical protein
MHGVPGIYHKFCVMLFSRNPVPLDLLNQTIPATETTNIYDINKYQCMKFTTSKFNLSKHRKGKT